MLYTNNITHMQREKENAWLSANPPSPTICTLSFFPNTQQYDFCLTLSQLQPSFFQNSDINLKNCIRWQFSFFFQSHECSDKRAINVFLLLSLSPMTTLFYLRLFPLKVSSFLTDSAQELRVIFVNQLLPIRRSEATITVKWNGDYNGSGPCE